MKFADVFKMLTCVVDVPRARALVKSVHIMPLKIRLSPKNICKEGLVNLLEWGKGFGGKKAEVTYCSNYNFDASFYGP